MSKTRLDRADLARDLLRRVQLDWMIGPDGRPTDAAWDRIPSLSSGELVVVAVAWWIIDYSLGDDAPKLSRLSVLDWDNLRAVGQAISAVAEAGSR